MTNTYCSPEQIAESPWIAGFDAGVYYYLFTDSAKTFGGRAIRPLLELVGLPQETELLYIDGHCDAVNALANLDFHQKGEK